MAHAMMRRLVLTALCLCVWASTVSAAIALRQHGTTTTTALANTSATTITSSLSGSVLIIGTEYGLAGGTVVSVTDNKGDTWVQATNAASAPIGGGGTDIWYFLTPASGVTTITVTYSSTSTNEKTAWYAEVTGFTTPAFDIAGHVTSGAAMGFNNPGPSLTTAAAAGFIWAVDQTALGNLTGMQGGNAFTFGDQQPGTGGASAYLITVGTGTYQPVWVSDTTADTVDSSAAAFKETAGGGCAAATGGLTLRGVGGCNN